MSTESLFHNFVIDKKEDAERFVEAILLSEQDPPFEPCCSVEHVTDPEEMKAFLDRALAVARADRERARQCARGSL